MRKEQGISVDYRKEPENTGCKKICNTHRNTVQNLPNWGSTVYFPFPSWWKMIDGKKAPFLCRGGG
jgi:hypothetical protein